MDLQPMGSRELGGGDGVAAGDLEHQAEAHDGRQRKRALRITAATTNATAIPITPGPHWRKLPRNWARSSGISSAGKDPGHEEDERVQQGESAEAAGGLLEQVDRKTQRASAGGRIACRGVHKGDLMVYRGHHLR